MDYNLLNFCIVVFWELLKFNKIINDRATESSINSVVGVDSPVILSILLLTFLNKLSVFVNDKLRLTSKILLV